MNVRASRVRPSPDSALGGQEAESAPRPEDPVRHWPGDKQLATLRVTGTNLRRRLGMTAAAIAVTEDQVADTLDHLARARPQDATRLRARAAQARQFAAQERDRAAEYGGPDADAPS